MILYCECESPIMDVEHDAGCRRCGRMVDFSPKLTTSDGVELPLVQALAIAEILGRELGSTWHMNECGCCACVHPPGDNTKGWIVNADGDADYVEVHPMSRDELDLYEIEEQGRRISRIYRRWDEAFQATAALTTAEDRVRLQERLALVATALREYEEAVHWEDTVPSSAELVKEISAVRTEVDRLLERTP